jgi:small ligand-binding sensory domain FIST
MDRKLSVSGVYSAGTQSTVFTLPFVDAGVDTVVLGAGYTNKRESESMLLTVLPDQQQP